MNGVLLMAYGAAASLDDIPAFLRDILGGRAPSDELVAEVRERYRLMGGKSPLVDITRRQAQALAAELNGGGTEPVRVYIGMRHSAPTILEAVESLKADGVERVIALPMTPYLSALSVGAYMTKLQEAMKEGDARAEVIKVDSWHDQPFLIEAFSRKLREALDRFSPAEREEVEVLFSAHSLPERILKDKDPYPGQLLATAAMVAQACGLRRYRFAFQSKGRTSEPWLGPDVAEELDLLRATGVRSVLVAPIGFISDHMETLYDDDILYRGQAERLGLRFERAAALNDDPLLVRALAAVVRGRLAAAARA